MIGLGPRTETLLASVFALAGNGEVKVTAICDLQDERIAKILGILESHGAEKPAVYKNYRELIASPDVDAVLVPTSWNSHLPIACDAMRMGKYVGIEVGIPNIANLYMTSPEVGISAGVAGTVVGMYWLLMLCGRLLGGVIGGKVSSKMMMTVVSSLAIIFILIGMFLPETFVKFPAISSDLSFSLVNIPLGVVFFVLCGLCTSVMWGAIFNLAVEGLGKYTSIASGLFMVMVCGGGVLPVIQGAIADSVGFMDSYWVLVVALAYILVFALYLSKPNAEKAK